MSPPPTAKRNAPRGKNTRGAESTTTNPQRNERAAHVKRSPATIPLKTLTRTDDTALVLELMRPSRDVRLAFTARDASNPTRVHRPAFVVVRAAELDDVIAILVATRDANLKARGGV